MTVSRTVSRYLLGASILAIGASPAFAQENDRAAAQEDDGVILVTANKREQDLQETPLAITAVTAETVELLGIAETADLEAIAPNVSVSGGTTNAAAAVVTIRGISTSADEALGFDSPIGLYVDGVYLARSAAASFEIADIERIEVLRGPQGTLFGRNTTGGAINYITSRPSFEAGADLTVGIGNYDRRYLRGSVNSGDIGGVRATVGLLFKARDGVVDNLLEPEDSRDPGSNETFGFRAAVEADLGENLMLTNIFDWTRIEGVPHAAQLSGVGDGVFRPNVTIDGNTFSQVQPAPVGPYLTNSSILQPECGAPLDSVTTNRLDEICLDDAGLSEDKVWGNMTRLELELGDVLVRSTTAFRWWRNEIDSSDLDGLGTIQGPLFEIGGPNPLATFAGFPTSVLTNVGIPAGNAAFIINSAGPINTTNQPLFAVSNDRGQDQFSQEIEIVGGTGSSFEWVVGAFYFEEQGFETNPQTFSFVLDTNQAVYTTSTADAILRGFQYPAATAAFLAPTFAADLRANNPARYRAVATGSTLAYTVDGQSYAIYGQGTWRPGGAESPFGITLGLRYSWDEKSVVRSQNGLAPFSTAEAIALNTQEASFSEPTGHLTIDYRASDDINLYARYAHGYRSGGFNLRQSTQVDNPATPTVNEAVGLIPFNEELIDSFEVGAKTEFGPLRLNVAAFYNMYSDLQSTVPIPIQGGGSFGTQVVNAGEIEYLGVEIEGLLELTDTLTLDGSFGYTHKNVIEFPAADINGVVQNIASVAVPSNSPDTTANAAITWSDYLGSGDTRLTARFGWSYTSGRSFFPNPLTAPFFDETSAGSRSLFNAQLRIDGISLGGDSEVAVQLWAKNIFDEEYVSRGIDYGQLGYGQILFGDPATFGLDVSFSF